MNRSLGHLLVLALLVVPLAACQVVSDKAGGRPPVAPRVLRLVNARDAFELQPYLDAVQAASAGGIVIDATSEFEHDTVEGEADLVRAVQNGKFELGLVPSRAMDGFQVTAFDALTAPMEIDSLSLQTAVLSTGIVDDMLRGVEPLGLVGVGILPGPLRVPAGITRPLVTPSDYVGARIAVGPSQLSERSLRLLGAEPVPTAFGGGAGLSDTLDGIEQQVSSIAENSYDARVRWITANVTLWPRTLVLVANQQAFAALTEQQRSQLREAARAAIAPTTSVQADQGAAIALCRRNRAQTVRATQAELEQLRSAFEPVYRQLRREQQTADFLARIDRLRDLAGPDPEDVLDCRRLLSSTPPGGADSTILDGNYLLHLSRAELAASGDMVADENFGDFRLALDHGRFVITQRSPRACTWAYGTFTVADSRLELVYLGGGGRSPNHATNSAGESFSFLVSNYRGEMRWSAVPDGPSPGQFVYKPWVRQLGEPARDFVDRRCAPPEEAFAR